MAYHAFTFGYNCVVVFFIVILMAGSGIQAQHMETTENPSEKKVRCTVSIAETHIGVDRHVRLNVEWENIGKQPAHWWIKGSGNAIEWKVTRPNGRRVLLTEYGRSIIKDVKKDEEADAGQGSATRTIRVTLKPGEKRNEQYLVSRIWDMTLSGEYKIEIEREFVAADGSKFKVRSQPVTVFIKEVLLRPKSPSSDEKNSKPVDGDSEASNPDP